MAESTQPSCDDPGQDLRRAPLGDCLLEVADRSSPVYDPGRRRGASTVVDPSCAEWRARDRRGA